MSVTLFEILHNVWIQGWIVSALSLLVASFSAIVFWQDTAKRSSRTFLFFGIVVSVWCIIYALFTGSLNTPLVHVMLSILYLVAGLVPLSLFLFLYDFSIKGNPFSFWRFVWIFAPYLCIAVLLAIPDFITGYDATLDNGLGARTFGKGYPIYGLYMLAFLTAGVVVLVRKYRESAGIFKFAIRNMLFSFFSMGTVATLVMLIFPLFWVGYDLFWVGLLGVIVFEFALAFILIKYNFLSLKIVMTEFFISIIALVLVAELFLATSTLDLLIKAGIAVLIVFSSSFLVGSIKREIQSSDKIARLLNDLDFMNKQLKVLDRKKSEFLSIASHHLRDPLTAIKGYSSMLIEGSFGELSPSLREAIEKIFESSKRLITMISDFMDISRIESGDMNYKFVEVDMKKLVLDLADEMRFNAEHAHLGFSVAIGDDLLKDESFVTVGDTGKLRQVISNIIDNSIKYTPRGELSLLLSKSPDRKKILFSVSDTGIGMNASTLEKIFRKFSRADGVSKVYTEGTGLGLYVAKELIKKHEGRIWAESKGEGMGSQFYVELEAKV